MPFLPTEDWSAICKKCHTHFEFGANYTFDEEVTEMSYGGTPYKTTRTAHLTPITTMQFPNGNIEQITIKCPHCREIQTYSNAELLRPSRIIEFELKEGKESLGKLKSENESLRAKIEGLETEISRLRKNNDTLTENNRILAHVIEDDRTKEANSSTSGGQSQSG